MYTGLDNYEKDPTKKIPMIQEEKNLVIQFKHIKYFAFILRLLL